MSKTCRIRWVSLALLASIAFIAKPARAQIAIYMDERGKLIYTNEDFPQPHQRSTIGSSSTTAEKQAISAVPSVTATESDATSPFAPADGRLEHIVQETAQRNSLDPALVKAVISTESGWNTRAISQKGAVGLMQLIPSTAQRFGVGNPFDPAQNVEGGTLYLKSLLERYNGDLTKSLAAYNAGERAVDLSGGVPAYRETQRYVQKVTNAYFRPDSGRASALWSPPRPTVRQEVDASGRAVFTNE